MFESLLKYDDANSFVFTVNDDLKTICSAPHSKSGIYLVYENESIFENLIYIGSSGHINNAGEMQVRRSGLGGIKDRLVNGHQFNNEKRHKCWPKQMNIEGIQHLIIQWYVTHGENFTDSPCYIEHCLLHEYFKFYGRLPRWNKKF